jgi:propionyl-CoA carboxylase beta chain
MGAKGAVEIIFKGKNVEEETKKYEHKFANPLEAARRGYVDDIVVPEDTRKIILDNLKTLELKHRPKIFKRHNNLPL